MLKYSSIYTINSKINIYMVYRHNILNGKADKNQASSKNMADNNNFSTYPIIQMLVIFC